jgi:hypothetical protein
MLLRQTDQRTYEVYICPVHGLLSERESHDAYQHHDGSEFGKFPDDDGYGETYYCGISERRWNGGAFVGTDCMEKLTWVKLVEADDAR